MLVLTVYGVQEQTSSGQAEAVSVMQLPSEAAKTAVSNPVFQEEADGVSDMEELH